MTFVTKETVSATTASGGGATVYTSPVNGEIMWIKYTRDDMATGMDLDITSEDTGQTIWSENDVSATKQVYPLAQAQATDGTDLDTAGDVSTHVIHVADERIKIAVTNGGNAKSGTFEVLVG